MTINAYKERQQKINEKLKGLQQENKHDSKKIEQLNADYEKAVSNMDDDEADKLHKQIYDIKRQIDKRTNKISILRDQNNPNLKQAATETIKAYYAEREKQLQEVDNIKKEIEQVREQYFNLCIKLKHINDEHSRIKETARQANKTADHSQLPQQAKSMLLGHSHLVNLSEFEILLQDIQEKMVCCKLKCKSKNNKKA